MVNIPLQQREPMERERLAAMRQVYATAKFVQGVQITCCVLAVVFLSALRVLIPSLAPFTVAWACLSALLDVVLFAPTIKRMSELGAQIQEIFDCSVLQLSFNDCKVRKPAPETVARWAARYRKWYRDDGLNRIGLDWYPARASALPPESARLVCQRANLWWDAEQRRRYAGGLKIAKWVLSGGVVLTAFASPLDWIALVTEIAAPLLPIMLFLCRQSSDNLDAARMQDGLRERVGVLMDDAKKGRLSPVQLDVESRRLQDEIYEKRRMSPLVPDFIYRWFQDENEALMNKAAEGIVDEITSALNSTVQHAWR
jgi:hypothetical protein